MRVWQCVIESSLNHHACSAVVRRRSEIILLWHRRVTVQSDSRRDHEHRVSLLTSESVPLQLEPSPTGSVRVTVASHWPWHAGGDWHSVFSMIRVLVLVY